MLTHLILVLIMSLVTVNGYANTLPERQQLNDQVDARIQKLETGQFVPVYTDVRNGLSWGLELPGEYTNGCVGANGQYEISKCTFKTLTDGSRVVKEDDSSAAIACKKIGARLPTEAEFMSLIRSFDHYIPRVGGPRLTAKGKADMLTVFGDEHLWFWSSLVISNDSDYAAVFDGSNGGITLYNREFRFAVRCVVEPVFP